MSSFNIPLTNDGQGLEPRFKKYLCADAIQVPGGPKGTEDDLYAAVKEAGYTGIQDGDPKRCLQHDLELSSGSRVNAVGEIEDLIKSKRTSVARHLLSM